MVSGSDSLDMTLIHQPLAPSSAIAIVTRLVCFKVIKGNHTRIQISAQLESKRKWSKTATMKFRNSFKSFYLGTRRFLQPGDYCDLVFTAV